MVNLEVNTGTYGDQGLTNIATITYKQLGMEKRDDLTIH